MFEDKPPRKERSRERERPIKRFHPVYLFLVLPFACLLWVPLYNRIEPTLLGIPFFYWYQMLWTVLGALCIVPVYFHEERRRK